MKEKRDLLLQLLNEHLHHDATCDKPVGRFPIRRVLNDKINIYKF